MEIFHLKSGLQIQLQLFAAIRNFQLLTRSLSFFLLPPWEVFLWTLFFCSEASSSCGTNLKWTMNAWAGDEGMLCIHRETDYKPEPEVLYQNKISGSKLQEIHTEFRMSTENHTLKFILSSSNPYVPRSQVLESPRPRVSTSSCPRDPSSPSPTFHAPESHPSLLGSTSHS